MAIMVIACGKKSASEGPVTGKYIDEFGNKFELREDHTATIQFAGQDKVNETRWYDAEHSDTSYVTIGYNGDSTYYYLSHGKLYRSKEQMRSCPLFFINDCSYYSNWSLFMNTQKR